ncbi:hypothetical protein L1D32_06100 [Shewanella insulae]|uniref:Uncharacterized protein n=2 Tax=Shewanella insulae TaxID=2681496 RepID=A0A6L7I0E0_9GAMM|nr:hypothetical protein [Shewanella insulae]MCG9711208.1 hypothetical protein [Shewanella insulae]MCG9737724.1 hypothetical protein [Shewanella insulae]MCG9753631.1 hypothetical protein [Shewanella insulae]MXR68801.1 hypothetical protein [Shewanella insulae]
MELRPNCYTDICVNGKWFHYDHGDHSVFMLNGGDPLTFELSELPTTEAELEAHLAIFTQQG